MAWNPNLGCSGLCVVSDNSHPSEARIFIIIHIRNSGSEPELLILGSLVSIARLAHGLERSLEALSIQSFLKKIDVHVKGNAEMPRLAF